MRDDNAVDVNWNTPLPELLDQNPNLPFNHRLVQKVFDERHILPGSLNSIDDLGLEPTVEKLLAAYRNDETRREFLAFYIEEVKAAPKCSRQEPFACDHLAVDPDNGLHMCAECGDEYMHGF